ncbi:hypothetical protein FNF29_08204 [Cafeteria roenbergensis]|uniref:RNA helicase n=1 Tax=Cafeteria roenbergensis TaxID=33653 RepID=A0A5A8C0M2_CAFRO|nr:hypothetical protein FNF29_08204 [Cafeteria roenbergensis]|eukprot:KAA0146187.1 hypothetical protein FNF29_08204 [Cafeteria roenbergensis]
MMLEDVHGVGTAYRRPKASRRARNELFERSPEQVDHDALLRMADMRSPHKWYPAARAMSPRRIVMHVGPTNSGKTFRALERLRQAKSGVYLAPLRLLAWEVSERLSDEGVPCDLLTGQERELREGARHVACTVEMADSTSSVEVAVIDEAQMIADSDRGWAWTRALLSLQAPEIHLCGDPSSVELVNRLAAVTGDTVEVMRYDRLAPLRVATAPLRGVRDIEPGDCVVAFGRKALYSLKEQIERSTGLTCGVIYGSLPPAVRRQQAKAFNSREGGLDVLVATDAVGMGLNLAIRRVVFSATEKYDGKQRRSLLPTEVKQIGGRAGRYSGDHSGSGLVTCLPGGDIGLVAKSMGARLPRIQAAGLLPATEQLEVFAAALLPSDQRQAALARIRRRHVASLLRASGARAGAGTAGPGSSIALAFESDSSTDEEDGDADDDDTDSDADGWDPALAGADARADGRDGGPVLELEELDDDAETITSEELDELIGMDGAAASGPAASPGLSASDPALFANLLDEVTGASPWASAVDDADDTSALGTPARAEGARDSETWDDLFSFDREDDETSEVSKLVGSKPEAASARDSAAKAVSSLPQQGGIPSHWSADIPTRAAASPGDSAAPTDQMEAWLAAAETAMPSDSASLPGSVHAPAGSGAQPELAFSKLLRLFEEHATVDDESFFVCDQTDVVALATAIDSVHPISLRDRHALCCAPLDSKSPLAKHAFVRWAVAVSRSKRVRVGLRVPSHAPTTASELGAVEDAHKVFDAYLWLARRWPSRFADAEDCERRLEATEAMIADGLERLGMQGAAEARRQAFEEQRSMRAVQAARTPHDDRFLAERERFGEADAGEDAEISSMLRAEVRRLRAVSDGVLGQAGSNRDALGATGLDKHQWRQLQSEAKVLARLSRRLQRGKRLTRKDRRAAAQLLDDSLTDRLAGSVPRSGREQASPRRRQAPSRSSEQAKLAALERELRA